MQRNGKQKVRNENLYWFKQKIRNDNLYWFLHHNVIPFINPPPPPPPKKNKEKEGKNRHQPKCRSNYKWPKINYNICQQKKEK